MRIKYCQKTSNIIDTLSNISYLIWFILKILNINNPLQSIISTMRIILMIKMIRHADSLKSFCITFKKSLKELFTLLIFLSIGCIFFATSVYYFEKETNSDFSTIPASIW